MFNTRGKVVSGPKSQKERVAFSSAEPNYYKLLGVPETATFKEITVAYREVMKRSHPDRQRPDRREAAEERAKVINIAYMTLSKADSRRAYDNEIKTTAIQDQIMNRYVGGFVPSGAADPFAEALRREQSKEERADQRRADRSATASMLIVFTGIAVVVIALLLVWALVDAIISVIA